MPLIELQRVPGLPKERHSVAVGTNLHECMSSYRTHNDVEITLNGEPLDDDFELNYNLRDNDTVCIYDQPSGGGLIGGVLDTIFTPIKFVQKIISPLFKQPSVNASSYNSKTSPNNSLKGQTNIARNGEAKPDNYGQIRAFPDLIQESLFEYKNNIKKVTEWMNFGIGEYAVTSVRYSESNLGSLAGASYEVFHPGTRIPLINEGFAFDDIDGQELPGPNESGDIPAETATTTIDMVSGIFSSGQALVKIKQSSEFGYFYDLTKPHSVSFIVNVTYDTVNGKETRDVTVFADLLSAVTTDDGAIVSPQYFYEFTFGNLSGNDIAQIPVTVTVNNSLFTLNDNEALVVGPSFSSVAGDELWVHLQAQLGHGDYARANVRYWQIDDENNQIPGTTGGVNIGLNNDDESADTKYGTFKISPPSGYGRYAIEFERANNSNDHSVLKVEAVHAVRVRTDVVYPNDTLVTVNVTATEQATSSRDRKYNALITRHTISYNLETQHVDYTLSPSRSFANAVAHTWLVMGKQAESSIDLFELYSIAKNLPDIRLGYFDYTFDDEDISLGDRVQTICDAATVTAYWDDGVLSFTRDQKRDTPVTVFNRSNMKADGYSISYDMTLPGGFDGVEVTYKNPVTNKQAFIRYRIVGDRIEEGAAVKPKKFSMLYVRNSYQARDRALKEVRRLLYSRMTMAVTALSDGEWVNIGQMVQVADIYDKNQQSGYIVNRIGNDFDTNEQIEWTGDMYVVITDSMGNPTSKYQASPRTDTRFGFSAAVPNISLNIWDGEDVQSPSRYIIATQVEMDATEWVVTEKKPSSDGATALTIIEYNAEMYNYEVIDS